MCSAGVFRCNSQQIKQMKPSFKSSDRLNLPAYPFADLERKAAALKASGKPVYNLSIGDPDLTPPRFVVEAAQKALDDPRSHLYPSSRGDYDVRCSVTKWFEGRFGVKLDPDKQVCITIGAKEGLANIARMVVNSGDTVAVPDPAYPVYGRAGCKLVDGKQVLLKLDPEHGFLPDIKNIENIKLLYLNYPNNPTGAEAPDDFLMELGKLADANPAMTLVYDMAYSEMCFDHPASSILEFTPNAIELHSLSKMACTTGYRVGFAVGNPDRIAALVRIKEEIDSGAPLPFQLALQAMLNAYRGDVPPQDILYYREVFSRRRKLIIEALEKMGFDVFNSQATFYVWFKVDDDEMPFISRTLEKGVLFTPGSGFGPGGRGWVRASVTVPDDVIAAVVSVIEDL